MLRFIRLSNPANCICCHRMLPTGRGAYWEAGIFVCLQCYEKVYGVVPETDEERRMLEELMAGNTNPQFVPEPAPPAPHKRRRGED